jgi:hypothetical protein
MATASSAARNTYGFGEHAWLEADTNDDGQLSWGELQSYNRGM